MKTRYQDFGRRYVASAKFLIPLFTTLSVLGIYISTIVPNPFTKTYPVAILGGVGFFVITKYFDPSSELSVSSYTIRVLVILYFSTVVAVFLLYRGAGMSRTFPVFVATFLLYALSAVLCYLSPRPTLGLGLICLSGVVNRITYYYASALYVGVDIFGHITHVRRILNSSSLDVLSQDKYFYAPFYHLQTAVGEIVTNLPLKDANALIWLPVITVVPTLVIFVVLRIFWEEDIALLGAVLYTASDFGINWGTHTVPTSFGVVLYGLVLLVSLNYVLHNRHRDFLLFALLIITLSFTHQVSLFITMTGTVALAGAHVLYSGRIRSNTRNLVLFTGLTVFFDFVLTKYAGPASDTAFFDQVIGFTVVGLLQGGLRSRTEFEIPADPAIAPTGSAGLTILQVAGSGLLVLLAIVGALYWIETRDRWVSNFGGFALGCVAAVLFAFTFGGPLVGIRNFLPFRWFAFVYFPLAMLAAPGIGAIVQRLNFGGTSRTAIAASILLLLLVPYIVLMGGNANSSSDSPLFDDAPMAERNSVLEEERALYEYVANHHAGQKPVVTDQRASGILIDYYQVDASPISITYGKPDSIIRPSLLVDRAYLRSPQAQYIIRHDGMRNRIAGPFPVQDLNPKTRETVYDSGDDKIRYLI